MQHHRDRQFDLLDERALEKFEARVSAGIDAGLTVASGGAELTVGKDPGNQLVLSDPEVSRFHCVIVATPRGMMIRDLGSTHGTRVNGVRVERAFVDEGSVVCLGTTVLEVRELGEKIRAPVIWQSFRKAKEAALAQWESEYLGELMKKHDGNISRASRVARMDRNHLRELLRKHAIPTPRSAPASAPPT